MTRPAHEQRILAAWFLVGSLFASVMGSMIVYEHVAQYLGDCKQFLFPPSGTGIDPAHPGVCEWVLNQVILWVSFTAGVFLISAISLHFVLRK